MEKCLTILFYFLLVSVAVADEYIVAPTNEIDYECVNESIECHDLSYYASHSDTYFTSDSTLTFLPGTHILDHNGPILITDVSNLTLLGDGQVIPTADFELLQTTVIITCIPGTNSGFLFRNFDDVTISGLTMINCGYTLTNDLVSYISERYFENHSIYNWDYTVGLHSSFSFLLFNGTNANIYELSLQYSPGYALTMVNVYGIDISRSWLTRSNFGPCYFNPSRGSSNPGGNIRIAYMDTAECPQGVDSTSVVSLNTVFIYRGSNCAQYPNHGLFFNPSRGGGGLAVMTHSYQCGSVELDFRSLVAQANRAEFGANVLLMGLPVKTYFENFVCTYGKFGFRGSGLSVWITREPPSDDDLTFTILGGLFVSNGYSTNDTRGVGLGAALYMNIYTNSFYTSVLLQTCEFRFNQGTSIIQILKQIPYAPQRLNLVLYNVLINGSAYNLNPYRFNFGVNPFDFNGALVLVNTHCIATNLAVINSNYTGIELLASVIEFRGNNIIQNNTNTNGGGMKLLRNSQINLYSPAPHLPPTTLQFIDNRAYELGGGIFIPVRTENDLTYDQPCFIQVVGSSDPVNAKLIVINNTAGTTGSFLGGGNLATCYTIGNVPLYSFSVNYDPFADPTSALHFLLSLIEPPVTIDDLDPYFVSSDSVGVFYCNKDNTLPLAGNFSYRPEIATWQGYYFDVVVSVVSDVYSFAPGNVTIIVQNCTYKNFTDCTDIPGQLTTVTIGAGCSNITAVVRGNSQSDYLRLRMNSGTNIYTLFFSDILLNVYSLTCPPGFTKEEICDCNRYIRDISNVEPTCNINTGMITLDSDGWVGYYITTDINDSNRTIYNSDCPFDFCKEGEVTFNLIDSPDDQCAYNRAGILCGGCADGYSLLLGSNECGKCPNNNYLSLLLVFGAAGIGLVFIIILLNLTVSVGTINGLIFYANIVKTFENVFFPEGGYQPYILRQFIAFLNLDFGIQVCFASGLTAYVKAWLQFVFPFYIWIILIVIIFLCRWFTKFAELFGKKTVQVLATLFLLSYPKLIRAIAISFGRWMIHFDDDYSQVRWSSDGNLAYSSPEVVVLIVFAALVLIFFVFPYTFILISLPVIGRILSIINWPCLTLRLRPFADAYSAPFKKSDQFWVGLLLLIRVAIGIVDNVLSDQFSLYVIIFVIMALLVVALDLQGPYEKVYLNVIESWFLVNLLGLCVLGLGSKTMAKIGAIVSVSLALLTFIAIIALHIYWLVKKHRMLYKDRLSKRASTNAPPAAINDLSVSVESGKLPKNVVSKTSITSEGTEMSMSASGNGSASMPTKSVISVAPPKKGRSRFDQFRDSILEVVDDGKND